MTKYFIEIRNRLVILLLTYFSTILITYLYKEILLFLIVKSDLTAYYFIFTNVTEIFLVYMNLIIFLSFQIMMLYFLFHLFIFFSPALFKTEYSYIKFLLKTVLICWFLSMLVANQIIIPLTWNFFLSFQDLILDKSFNIHFEARLSEYINFCISLYYICGFYFQIFILTFFIINYISFNINSIRKFRKLYYFSFVIFSTLISPPDIISQLFISLFLIVFYETFIFIFIFKNALVR